MKTALKLVMILVLVWVMTPGVASAACSDWRCKTAERVAAAAERQAKALEQMQKDLVYQTCLLAKRENPDKVCNRDNEN